MRALASPSGGLEGLRTSFKDVVAIPDLGRYWGGQLLSDIGSEATMFVLMTSVYLETGSLTQFALLFALDELPDVLLSPTAGVMVDRFDRRWLHIIGDGGVALTTVAALILWSAGSLSVAAIYALIIVGATFQVIQGASAEAMYQQLVPRDKLVRVGAAMGITDELVTVVAWALGIGLVVVANTGAVFVFDLLTFGVALWTLMTFKDPGQFRSHLDGDGPQLRAEDDDSDPTFSAGIRYLRSEPGMGFIFVYSMLDGFLSSLVLLMAATAALEFGGNTTLLAVQWSSGFGAVLGLFLILGLGLRRGNVVTRNVVMPGLVIGLLLLTVPVVASPAILVGTGFGIMLLSAPLDAAIDATYLAAVPKRLIGRVSAAFDTVEGLLSLVLLVIIAPAIELVLAPAVATSGVDLGWFGTVGGDGENVDSLLLVIGMAGLAMVAMNIIAAFSGSRTSADQLAEALEEPPIPPAAFATQERSSSPGDQS